MKKNIVLTRLLAGMLLVTLSACQLPDDKVRERPSASRVLPAESDLIPFRDSWLYATVLNFRPANDAEATTNPPRLSWPYLQEIIAVDDVLPPTVFTLQIAGDDQFDALALEVVDTPYNFYNALPVLEPGTWYWRVGYGAAPAQEWSPTRRFVIHEDTPEWDRMVIHDAVDLLAAQPRPRSGPPDGDWAAFLAQLQADPLSANVMGRLYQAAERGLRQPWWTDFPETDVYAQAPSQRSVRVRYINILKSLSNIAYLYRLTGEPRYEPALGKILKMADWPRGGLLSPENLSGFTKMPSQAVELFAAVYDWFADDLSETDAARLRAAIQWRLHDMYYDARSMIWQQGDETMRPYGLAYSAASHPYQNYAWTMPAILLMAGECEVADELVPLALHYLTGVTAPDGPDEGYNEGHGYSNEKAGSLLRAAVVTDMLLPELKIGRNPAIQGLTSWFVFLFSGSDRLPWGDSWLGTARGQGGENLIQLAYLTGSPLAKHHWQDRAPGQVAENPNSGYSRPWFELGAWVRYRDQMEAIPPLTDAPRDYFLPEAGWMFTQSQPINTVSDFEDTVGLQFQMRPRGGYAHSYPSDGSFVWFAYGETLNCGGGWQSWASEHFSRNPMSQNMTLIDGRGPDSINTRAPQRAYTARPLAYHEGDDHVYWAADLTEGYRVAADVERVHRHIVFLNRRWFVIFDDLALQPQAAPATFSWLYHIRPDVPLTLGDDRVGFAYPMGEVQAAVWLAQSPQTVRIENREGREGYRNPLTGEDLLPPDETRARNRAIFNPFLDHPPMQHNIWVHSRQPASEFEYLAVLTAAGPGTTPPTVRFDGDRHVTIVDETGESISVSFDPSRPADVVIEVDRVRAWALTSAPE